MPPIQHGRYTLNETESVRRKDNTGRYDRVVIDEHDGETVVRSVVKELSEPIDHKTLVALLAGLNSGRISRFDLGD